MSVEVIDARSGGGVLGDLLAPRDRRAAARPGAWARSAALVVAGAAWVAGLSQVAIPLGFTPVPLSLGTFAVLSAGAVLGPWRGLAALGLYMAVGVAGGPVFAGGNSGAATATFGYVVGYVGAAGLVGALARRGADRRPWSMFAAMAAGSAVIYLFGVPWLALAADLGPQAALAQGLVPFLPGDAIKAAAAAGAFPVIWRFVAGPRRA
jgi:biotin transport system substrate-specific component